MITIRIIGMLLTLAASTAFGLYLSHLGTFRRADLLEIKKALLILKSEIEYTAAPLPDAMTNIAARISTPVANLFAAFANMLKHNHEGETAYQLWLNAIDENKQNTFLKPEDWEVISSFGKTLGYLDKQMQVDTIRFTMDYIDSQITELQESNPKNSKMYKSLGVIGGILLLVIFW